MDQIHVNHLITLVVGQWFLLYFGRNSTCVGNSFRCFTLTNLCHFRLRFILCRCWSNISLNCRFESLQKILLVKKIEQERKLIYQGREHLLSEICNHSSVSLGSTDWLLFLRCNNGCTNPWKSGYPKLISLSHGVSKIPFSSWTSRRRARSSGLKCLEQTTELRRLSLRTFRLHEIEPSLSLSFSVSSLQDNHRHKTVWYEVQYLSVCFLCCYIPLQHT